MRQREVLNPFGLSVALQARSRSPLVMHFEFAASRRSLS
jgi:hypothetical protein